MAIKEMESRMGCEVEIIFGEDERVVSFVVSHPPYNPALGFGNCTTLGFVLDGKLIAGVVYSNYDEEAATIEMSAYADNPRWFTRKTIRKIFGYVFEQLACQLAIWRVSEFNGPARELAEKMGFQGTRIRRLRGRDEDAIVYTLTVEDWLKWPAQLRDRHEAISSEGA